MCYFFFNDTATTEIYTLSLHDALPISLIAYMILTEYLWKFRLKNALREWCKHALLVWHFFVPIFRLCIYACCINCCNKMFTRLSFAGPAPYSCETKQIEPTWSEQNCLYAGLWSINPTVGVTHFMSADAAGRLAVIHNIFTAASTIICP